MRDRGETIVDVRREPQDEYSEHCRQADIMSAPLRDCLSYYNGHGDANPEASPIMATAGTSTAPARRRRSSHTSSVRRERIDRQIIGK